MDDEDFEKIDPRLKNRYMKTIGYDDKFKPKVTHILLPPNTQQLWDMYDKINEQYPNGILEKDKGE